jgi:hypothetical protein
MIANATLAMISAIVGLAIAIALPTGMASAKDAAKAERCHQLYDLMVQYKIESVPHHNSGARFRAEVAESLCAAGDYDRGIADLETEVRRAGIPLPPQK